MSLLNEVKQGFDKAEHLEESAQLVTENTQLLCENAEDILAKVTAQLKAEKDPFENNEKNAKIVAGLMLLDKPEARDALNIDRRKLGIILNYAGEKDEVTTKLAQIGGTHAKSLYKRLKQQGKDLDRELVQKLDKLKHDFELLRNKIKNERKSQENKKPRKRDRTVK